MQRPRTLVRTGPRARAAPTLVAAGRLWGVLAGIGGVVHGIGEVAQGNVPTPGLFIPSWASGPIADNLGGEPGLTLVPNFLASGILTLVVASLLVIVSIGRADARSDGWAMLGLSAAMLLVGGGVGPPVIGLCAGAAVLVGLRARASRQQSAGSALWAWLFWLSLADTFFLVFGSLVAAFVLDVDASTAFVYAFLAALALLPSAILAGRRAGWKDAPA